jgi:hypothetical protein
MSDLIWFALLILAAKGAGHVVVDLWWVVAEARRGWRYRRGLKRVRRLNVSD